MLRTLLFVSLVSTSAFASPAPIVGGTPVEHGEWPDVVGIIGEHGRCTGTLIAADLVLTAAHCIEIAPTEVVVGSIDLARPDGQWRRVKWARAYPQWIDKYDAGVIMLENPVFAKQRAVAQGCAPRDRLKPGTPLQVVGFGLTTEAATDDNTRLQQVTVEITDPLCTSDAGCASAVAPGGELIAGGHGADACFGDSGGPAYIATPNGPALVGIVSRALASWTNPCGEGGIYVRADKVVAWIQSVSGRKLDRAPCDLPADAPGVSEPAGCSAGGAVDSGLAVVFGAWILVGLRRARRRR